MTRQDRFRFRWWPANRLFLRVFGVFGSLLLGMTLIYGALIIPLQRDSLLKVMYSQAATVSRSIIQASSDAMLTDDYGFIVEHNLQVLQNNTSIKSVLVVPKRGTAISLTPAGWEMLDSEQMAATPVGFDLESFGIVEDASGGSRYRYTTPIRFSGVGWGAIRIDFDTSEYAANIAEMYRQLLYISLLAVLAILPIGYVFALWVTRPIATISEAASRVARGDLNAHVAVERRDEIGQLSKSFNQMVDALQQNRDRLRNYHQELERKVAERTRELDELNRTLDRRVRDEVARRKEQEYLLIRQSRLAAMGEMIGAIAHQWRQPLNALGLVLQNLRMQYDLGRLDDQSMRRMEEKASQLVQRMSSTIDEFRNFFRPAKHPEPFNLAQTIASAADIMDGVFRNHGITLTTDCDARIELVGIAGEFAQVILNLLGNAKDALLRSGRADLVIQISAARVGDRVIVEVEDDGGGIDPEIIDKIFEPYFTTKEEGQGSGIGLYMSKMIVENSLHGSLEVTNTPLGARFTISLPAQAVT